MKYTYQLMSDSGSFGVPEGDDVRDGRKVSAENLLDSWEREHDRVGSDRKDAYLLAWIGRIGNTTDVYPDYEVHRGPRGGLVWSRA